MTKTAIVENLGNESSYVVCTISPSEAKEIIKEHQDLEDKSVASFVPEKSSIKSHSDEGSQKSNKNMSRSAKLTEEEQGVLNIPGSVSVPSEKSGHVGLTTVWEEERRDGEAISTTSSVSTHWDRQGNKSVWQKKYEGEKKINDVLRRELHQRDGEIEHLGQQAYKKVQKLRSQREARDRKIAALGERISVLEAELAREKEHHENTKAALKVQVEDNIIAREEAVTMKHKASLLDHRMHEIAKVFGRTDSGSKPSISPNSVIRRQSSARADRKSVV